jgi:hypothetical protein
MEPLYVLIPEQPRRVPATIVACRFGEGPEEAYRKDPDADLFVTLKAEDDEVVFGYRSAKVMPHVRRWGPRNPRQLEGLEAELVFEGSTPVGFVPVSSRKKTVAKKPEKKRTVRKPAASARERRAKPALEGRDGLVLDVYGIRDEAWPVVVLEAATRTLLEIYGETLEAKSRASEIKELASIVRNELELAFTGKGKTIPNSTGKVLQGDSLEIYITEGRIWQIKPLPPH